MVLLSCEPDDPNSTDLPPTTRILPVKNRMKMHHSEGAPSYLRKRSTLWGPQLLHLRLSTRGSPFWQPKLQLLRDHRSYILNLNFLKELSREGFSSSRLTLFRLDDPSVPLQVHGMSLDSAFFGGLPRSRPLWPKAHAGFILPPLIKDSTRRDWSQDAVIQNGHIPISSTAFTLVLRTSSVSPSPCKCHPQDF